MAEINFLNTNSNEIYKTIMEELENGVSEPLYPGDERRIFGEALVPIFVALFTSFNDAAKQKLLRYARKEVLDALGERAGVERLTPVPAKTTMRFSLSEPLGQNVIIPMGTRVTSDFVLYFQTNGAAVIPAGELYVDIEATSADGGEIYNGLAPGIINTLVDLIPYVDNVENTTTTYGGGNEEDDDSLRERIRLSPVVSSTAGPIEAYRYWAKTAEPSISDVAIVSPSKGEVEIIPILIGGELPDEGVLQKVLETVSADDVRPLTDHVTVRAPDTEQYDIEIKYYTTAADESRVIETVEGAGGAISRYINWQGSVLGRDINPDRLRALILTPNWEGENLAGAIRVEVTSPVYTQLPNTSVAKFSGNLTVTHEVAEE